MESPGRYLKTERESQNLSLRDVSKWTRINERLLKAIEEDKYELLSSPVYVKGFLEAYARYLGLDPNDLILRYQNYLESMAPPGEAGMEHRLTFKKRRVSLWLLLVFAVVLSLGVSIFFFSFNPLDHFLSSFEKGKSTLTPLPSQTSPPPIQKEEDTQATGLPEKSRNQ